MENRSSAMSVVTPAASGLFLIVIIHGLPRASFLANQVTFRFLLEFLRRKHYRYHSDTDALLLWPASSDGRSLAGLFFTGCRRTLHPLGVIATWHIYFRLHQPFTLASC